MLGVVNRLLSIVEDFNTRLSNNGLNVELSELALMLKGSIGQLNIGYVTEYDLVNDKAAVIMIIYNDGKPILKARFDIRGNVSVLKVKEAVNKAASELRRQVFMD